jgi:serine/threonine protein phosphatase 1
MKNNTIVRLWYLQGGEATINSYIGNPVPESHIQFLESGTVMYRDDKDRVFVHGGFDIKKPPEHNDPETLMWDRGIIQYALGGEIIPFCSHIYIGHTSTQLIKSRGGTTLPITVSNLTMLDTGAGWSGKLTIMDIGTGEFWQSDKQRPRVE